MPSFDPHANIDPSEIRKFEAMANRWWDTNSEFKPLHDINPLRLNYIQQHAPLDSKRVLDVGCGGGILSESMAAAGADVTGIDMGSAPLEIAELHLLESGLTVDYQQITAEELAQSASAAFDVVTCMEMLEHVPDPSSVIQACHDLVKPGGHVFFSTLNRNPKSYLFAILGAEYLLNLLPKGTHDYAQFIRPAELARWCRTAGLQTTHQSGMTYHPLTRRYRLNPRNLEVNYLVATTRAN